MKKWICGILSLMLVLCSTAALAAARMPQSRGVLTDDADVLSAAVSAAITEYAGDVENEVDVNLHVAIVHFFDGLDAQTFANRLFEKWELGKEDLLLVCAAGEDSFATALGSEVEKELGKQNVDNLLYTSSEFSAHIARQEYDLAFAKYFAAFNELINKRFDSSVTLPKTLASVGSYNGGAVQEYQSQPSGLGGLWNQITSGVAGEREDTVYMPSLWTQTVQGVVDNSADYTHYTEQDSSNGIGVGGWIILIILILIIFSQSHPVRKAKRSYRKSGGSKPLGWIGALIGLSVLSKLFRK
ncbi:MAG: TPM domain-containing protein [Clostridia bacterium]|nr:TPM domain-containing protein [Clostridia bacterium]